MVRESADQAAARSATQNSEIDLALAFAGERQGQWILDHSRRQWHGYDPATGIFHPDRKEALLLDVQQFIHARAGGEPRLLKASVVSAVERLLRMQEVFAVTADEMDADPFVLGTPGGPYDLTTGRRLDPDPSLLITQSTSVAPEFDIPTLWLQFLGEATGHDLELITYLQRLCGYCLTGSTREEQLSFFWGSGGNGKGVFLGTLKDIAGSYAETTSTDTFLETRGDRNENDLAMLAGKRVAIAQESNEGRKWDAQRIKTCTGRDTVRAKYLYKDLFTFVPQFTLLIASNHRPRIGTVDDAWRRRLQLIPFVLKPAQPDPLLKEKLVDEYPAILGWMIEGAMLWHKDGLMVPESVLAASAKYLAEEDTIGLWFDECCKLDNGADTARKELYGSYSGWCREMGHGAATVYAITRWLKGNKGVEQNMKKGTRPYLGVRLKDPFAEDADPPAKATASSRAGDWHPDSQDDGDAIPF
jgi:putative DNA primase/helicase